MVGSIRAELFNQHYVFSIIALFGILATRIKLLLHSYIPSSTRVTEGLVEVPDMKEWYFKSLFSLILSAIDRIVYLPFFQEDLGHSLFRLQLGQRSA